MKIKEMSWFERPDNRLKLNDPEYLSDAELLSLILWRGNPKESAFELSHRILKEHLSIASLSKLTLPELSAAFGGDESRAVQMLSFFELSKRLQRLLRGGCQRKIKTARDVFNFYADSLKEKREEHFCVLYLNTKNMVISDELISKGIDNATIIHPREVFNLAVRLSAHSIILVHNHPSGDPTPSSEDEQITKMIVEAGEIIGIKVLDHVIVGNEEFVSLREQGKL